MLPNLEELFTSQRYQALTKNTFATNCYFVATGIQKESYDWL